MNIFKLNVNCCSGLLKGGILCVTGMFIFMVIIVLFHFIQRQKILTLQILENLTIFIACK